MNSTAGGFNWDNFLPASIRDPLSLKTWNFRKKIILTFYCRITNLKLSKRLWLVDKFPKTWLLSNHDVPTFQDESTNSDNPKYFKRAPVVILNVNAF